MSYQRLPQATHSLTLPPISSIDEFIQPRALPTPPLQTLQPDQWKYSSPPPASYAHARSSSSSSSSPLAIAGPVDHIPISPPSSLVSNYARSSLNEPPLIPHQPAIEHDVDEIIRHCDTLRQTVSHHKHALVHVTPSSHPRLSLDSMIGSANEVLNALLRLRKHQLAVEHLHRRREHSTTQDDPGVRPRKRSQKRAVFQGRCQSCNISETPEWRRGPDGARTLCNACGLHYAKLARKKKTASSHDLAASASPVVARLSTL